jgi:hypothetical protein
MTIPGEAYLPGEDASGGTDGKALKDRTGPTWRGFVLAILAAILLSVTTTLLLGGSWSSYSLGPAAAGSSGGCGPGAPCCPPQQGQEAAK